MENLKICVAQQLMIFTRTKGNEAYKYLCNDARQTIRGCLTDVVDKVKACSNPDEKYLTQFGFDVFDSVFKFYCKDDMLAIKRMYQESIPKYIF